VVRPAESSAPLVLRCDGGFRLNDGGPSWLATVSRRPPFLRPDRGRCAWIAAAQIASEYTLGTLRQLIVRQPRRVVLLVGKYLAVVSPLVAAVIVAAVLSGFTSMAMAHVRGVDTSAWSSEPGIHALSQALANVSLAVIGFAMLGMIVGLVLRSSVAAVIVGFAYLREHRGCAGQRHCWLAAGVTTLAEIRLS